MATETDLSASYKVDVETLIRSATAQFSISHEDAERLARDVMVASLRHLPSISDRRSWLMAAMISATRRYVATASAEKDEVT